MSAAISEHDVTVLLGDVREQLATIDAGSVQCAVTSPPYYGLRDYGTGQWEGGAPDCDHLMPPLGGTKKSGLNAKRDGDGFLAEDRKSQPNRAAYPNACRKCGATRTDRQIGLEASPAEYVAEMVGVFREVRRVLADDGVLWLNLGDSYSGGNRGSYDPPGHLTGGVPLARPITDVPAKNLLGIPWRVAFALQDDGWTLRNAVIWHKPNAMPESVTDRLSTRYEHVFLFSKSRRYWFDLDAVREPHIYGDDARVLPRSPRAQLGFADHPDHGRAGIHELGRNPGDVWTIPTSPFPGAHFATMPPALARRCILAGSPEGATVLDPFTGSGTTAMVARQLGRKFVGVELNPAYIDIIRERIGQEPLNFEEASA